MTLPVEASAGQLLQHPVSHAANPQLVVAGFEALRSLLRSAATGETPVVLHIPTGNGQIQQMHLRSGVAYDADLVAAVQRSLGTDLVELRLT